MLLFNNGNPSVRFDSMCMVCDAVFIFMHSFFSSWGCGLYVVMVCLFILCVFLFDSFIDWFSFFYKQNNGRMNKSGIKNGTIQSDNPQVQNDAKKEKKMMHRMVKDTKKHPPRLRYDTMIVAPFVRRIGVLHPEEEESRGLPFHTKHKSCDRKFDFAATCFLMDTISSKRGSTCKQRV